MKIFLFLKDFFSFLLLLAVAFAHPSAKGEPKPGASADARLNRKRGPNPITDSQYLLTPTKNSEQVSLGSVHKQRRIKHIFCIAFRSQSYKACFNLIYVEWFKKMLHAHLKKCPKILEYLVLKSLLPEKSLFQVYFYFENHFQVE